MSGPASAFDVESRGKIHVGVHSDDLNTEASPGAGFHRQSTLTVASKVESVRQEQDSRGNVMQHSLLYGFILLAGGVITIIIAATENSPGWIALGIVLLIFGCILMRHALSRPPDRKHFQFATDDAQTLETMKSIADDAHVSQDPSVAAYYGNMHVTHKGKSTQRAKQLKGSLALASCPTCHTPNTAHRSVCQNPTCGVSVLFDKDIHEHEDHTTIADAAPQHNAGVGFVDGEAKQQHRPAQHSVVLSADGVRQLGSVSSQDPSAHAAAKVDLSVARAKATAKASADTPNAMTIEQVSQNTGGSSFASMHSAADPALRDAVAADLSGGKVVGAPQHHTVTMEQVPQRAAEITQAGHDAGNTVQAVDAGTLAELEEHADALDGQGDAVVTGGEDPEEPSLDAAAAGDMREAPQQADEQDTSSSPANQEETTVSKKKKKKKSKKKQ